VIINTARSPRSRADGQAAYAASRAASCMTLPIARDLASLKIRGVTIAPALFHTPLLAGPPDRGHRARWARRYRTRPGWATPPSTPRWPGTSWRTPCSTGKIIRLDGAIRMSPR